VSDQLSLSLSGDVANLPPPMRPMMPRSGEAPFDSLEHVFEPVWGGRRVLAYVEPGRADKPSLRLFDANGHDLAPYFPELAYITELVADPPAVLDGELVVPDKSGRMDVDALNRRLADDPTNRSAAVYLAFDVLWVAGRPLLAQPLVKRREMLAKALTATPELVIVPGVVGDGRELHFAVAQQGLAGVMARHLRSPYLPGRHSELWRWIPTQPGEVRLRLVPDPAPTVARPVLALIQRLPLDD
jgi:bifunctional non-homologous end joining protein LigD